MCRDFNPKQVECGMALVTLYLSNGLLNGALIETDKLLKTKYEDRTMLNHYKNWECEVPRLAVKMMTYKFQLLTQENKELNLAEVKYLFLLAQIVQQPKCQSYRVFLESDTVAEVSKLAYKYRFGSLQYPNNALTIDSICKDQQFLQFLKITEYTLHPCTDFLNDKYTLDTCGIFYSEHPALYEVPVIYTTIHTMIFASIRLFIIVY